MSKEHWDDKLREQMLCKTVFDKKGEQMKCNGCEYDPTSRENEKTCSICCHNKFYPTFYDNFTPKRSKADKFCDWLKSRAQQEIDSGIISMYNLTVTMEEVKIALKDAGYEESTYPRTDGKYWCVKCGEDHEDGTGCMYKEKS